MNRNTVILTHSGADLDAISSMFAAGKLYPGSFLIHPGSLDTTTQKMVALFGDTLRLIKVKELPNKVKQNIDRVIVVDTKIPERIGNGKEFIDKKGVEVIVFDHHPESPHDLQNAKIIYKNYGSNTTILTELLKKKQVALTSIEATIIALGIYEDTGSFMFPSIRHNDFEAVAFLSLFGINMKIIRHFVSPFLSEKQLSLMEELISNMEEFSINGIKTIITHAKVKKYIPGISVVTHRLREIVDSDLLFVITETGKGTFITGRSNSPDYNVKNILFKFRGGGHTTAATAYIENCNVEKIKRQLIEEIKNTSFPILKAGNIMSFPVKTIDAKTGIKEAFKIMARMGFSGLPVTEKNKPIGIISKRDIEKILLVESRNRPVKQYLTPNIVKVSVDSDIRKIEELMVINNVGRVLVEKNEKIVGIISRSDLLKAFYAANAVSNANLFSKAAIPSREEVVSFIKNSFSKDILDLFMLFGEVAEKTNQHIYIVGGAVRDLFLGKKSEDLDFVLDKSAVIFARELSKKILANIKLSPEFEAAHLKFKNYSFDFSTTRREYYEGSSLLPKVEFASLKDDLKRRDFTINALAVSINKEDFGRIFDFFNGFNDLKNKTLRVMHGLSFIEDPSRLLRAIKYESKFGFTLSQNTKQLFINAVNLHVLKARKSQRIIGELLELLSAEYAPVAILKMAERGVLYDFFGIKKLSQKRKRAIVQSEEWITRFKVNRLYTFLFLLLHGKKSSEISEKLRYLSIKSKITSNLILAEKIFKKLSKQLDKIEKVELFFTLKKVLTPFIVGFILYVKEDRRIKLIDYIEYLQYTKPELTGKELKALGISEGKQYTEIFNTLTALRIEGKVKTKEDEINYILKNKEMFVARNGQFNKKDNR
jgi:tRNA nucleotidyltransferase (CCA-adding enzyme)